MFNPVDDLSEEKWVYRSAPGMLKLGNVAKRCKTYFVWIESQT